MGRGVKANVVRRARHCRQADTVATETHLPVPLARHWLQFHGFNVWDAVQKFREVADVVGEPDAIEVVRLVFRDKQFKPGEFEGGPSLPAH